VFIPHVSSAAMAEALAMLNGLNLANSLGCNAIEAESYLMEVIQLCPGEDRTWNEGITIYSDIVTQSAGIWKIEFKHCGRDLNVAAHVILINRFFFSVFF
jgi:hypothetical protein